MPKQHHGLSRREAMKTIAGSAGAVVGFPVLSRAAVASTRFFDSHQNESLAALVKTIIPTDEHSPGAAAARVHEYIDEVVADSSHDSKSFWTRGIAAVDEMAESDIGKKFKDCSEAERIALLEKLAANEERPVTLADKFFVALKRSTIHAYYTSEIGIHKELEYQGNTALADFEGCPHEEHGKP